MSSLEMIVSWMSESHRAIKCPVFCTGISRHISVGLMIGPASFARDERTLIINDEIITWNN